VKYTPTDAIHHHKRQGSNKLEVNDLNIKVSPPTTKARSYVDNKWGKTELKSKRSLDRSLRKTTKPSFTPKQVAEGLCPIQPD